MAPKEPFSHSQLVARRQHDPQLRLHTPAPEAEDDAPESYIDPRHYEALRTSKRPPRLRIRCHDQPGRSIPYM